MNPTKFLLFTFTLLCLISATHRLSGQEEHKEIWHIVQTVQDILAGKNLAQALPAITKGARLVYGTRYENLREVVSGEVKSCTLADTSYHGVAIQARTNPSEDMGLLILKTRASDTTKVRYHTVVFLKDSTGQFRIISWHTGD